MTSYSLRKVNIPTSLDEIGLNVSLPRLREESLAEYRKRLLFHVKESPSPIKKSILSSGMRNVGLSNKRIAIVSVDYNLAPDPRIEIKAFSLKVWSNYSEAADSPDLDISFGARGTNYFVRDVFNQLSSLSFLTISYEDEYYDYEHSRKLMVSNTDLISDNVILSNSTLNSFFGESKRIINVKFSNGAVFANEVNSDEEVIQNGDYYVNKEHGYVKSFIRASGEAFIEYSSFPFSIFVQPVKSYELNDSSIDLVTKEILLTENGEEKLLLTPEGSDLYNQLLTISNITWGD